MFPSSSLRITPLHAGSSIGKYEVVRPLARGGMAELYLVKSLGLHNFESLCVLKRLPPHYLVSEPNIVNMFLDEAQLTASVRHPNVPSVFDFGEDHESYFFVMEYVEGQSVSEILQKCFAARTRVPLEVALEIVMGVLEALSAAHEATDVNGHHLELVHRDVSPQNILVTQHGGIKLIDFGIAQARKRRENTQAGHIKGKFSYMSPEQCLADPADRRTDLYSLGIILYELTTMRRPHGQISGPELLYARSCVDAVDPRNIVPSYPDGLAKIVNRLLRRNPSERYASAREVHDELTGFAREQRFLLSPFAVHSWVEGLEKPLARGSGSWTATNEIPVAANEERPRRALSHAATAVLSTGACAHALALKDTQRAEVTRYDFQILAERNRRLPPPPPMPKRRVPAEANVEERTSAQPSRAVSGRRVVTVTAVFLLVFFSSLGVVLASHGQLRGMVVDVLKLLPA